MVRGLSTAHVSQRGARRGFAPRPSPHTHRLAGPVAKRVGAGSGGQEGRRSLWRPGSLSNDDAPRGARGRCRQPARRHSVMRHLADDSHHAVLVALASNPNVPHEVADRLANHRRADVRNAAIRRFERRDEPVATGALDPDSHIPELRDRVQAPPQVVPDPARWTRAKWSTTRGYDAIAPRAAPFRQAPSQRPLPRHPRRTHPFPASP